MKIVNKSKFIEDTDSITQSRRMSLSDKVRSSIGLSKSSSTRVIRDKAYEAFLMINEVSCASK